MIVEDCYRTLQVDPAAESEVIEAAWRRLAQLYHPDGLRPDGDRMKAINVAHDVLKDPARRAAHDRDRDRRTAPSAARPAASAAMLCTQHSDREAVSWCESCWQPLCGRCAELWWPSSLCARCVRRQARRRQWEVAWPMAYGLAWLIVGVLWSSLVSAWAPSQPWENLEQMGPSALIGYLLGCGPVGAVDLALLARKSGQRFAPAGCLAVPFTIPLALAAGCVFAPFRAVFAMVGWLRALLLDFGDHVSAR